MFESPSPFPASTSRSNIIKSRKANKARRKGDHYLIEPGPNLSVPTGDSRSAAGSGDINDGDGGDGTAGNRGNGRRSRWARGKRQRQQAQFDIDRPAEEMEASTAEQIKDMNGAIFGPKYDTAVRRRDLYNPDLVLGPLYEQEDLHQGLSDQVFGMDWRSEHEGNWLRVDAVVDSGAAKPGARPDKNISAANGAPLPNFGQQLLSMYTDEGMETSVVFQLCDMTRPLLSVSAICDYGNRVVFGRGGGIIYNLDTGLEIPFARQGGFYSIGLWVCDKGSAAVPASASAAAQGGQAASSGFTRQGRR